MAHVLPKVLLLSSAMAFVACGKNGDDKDDDEKGFKVKAELLRTEGATYDLFPLTATTQDASRYAWTSNIDIKSLKLPITSITLSEMTPGSGVKNPQVIYSCETNCDVDLLGPELENLLKDHVAEITATGSFQKIAIGFSNNDDLEWKGKIKAEFTLGGKKYYTKADGTVSTEGPAEEATYDGHGGGSVSYLPQPIEIAEVEPQPPEDGEEAPEPESVSLTVKLYFDPLYTAYAIDRSIVPYTIPDAFCVGAEDGIKVCTQRLVVAASTQAAVPTRERYLVNDSSLVSLFFDNDDTPVGGNMVAVYKEGEPFLGMAGGVDATEPGAQGPFGMWASGPIFEFAKNSDGTYLVSSLVGETDASNEDSGFRAKAFKRESHIGTFETGSGADWDYTATKL